MSSDKNRSGPRPRTAALAATAIAAGIVLLTAACGGGSSSNPADSSSSGSSTIAEDVAYADCMNAHGVDITVNSNGDFSESNTSNSSSSSPSSQQAETAETACQHLLPSSDQPSQARELSHFEQLLKYTQCMRTHGVPNFPDPVSEGNGAYSFGAPQAAPSNGAGGGGINPNSPTYQKAGQACESIMPNLRQP